MEARQVGSTLESDKVVKAGLEVWIRAAVGIHELSGSLKQESFVVVNEDSNRLIFINKADKGAQSCLPHVHGNVCRSRQQWLFGFETEMKRNPRFGYDWLLSKESCFTIDGVFRLDTGQDKLFLEYLQPLLDMVPLGYSVSLLVCEGHHCRSQAKTQGFIQRVIESVFYKTCSSENSVQSLQTISFVQIYTDGKALDLLNPRSQSLQVMDLPSLGLVVEEATEIIVTDSQAATNLYLHGICGLLFTIITEVKAVEDQGFQRTTVRILEFSEGDEETCTDHFSTLSWASSVVALPPEAGFLSWVLKHLLEANALTFLLLCLTLPVSSGEEILSAVSLTEQIRAIRKRVTPVYWDPVLEAQKRRKEIGELRMQLSLCRRMEQDSMLNQLGKAIKELQVLKSQNWEKKKERSACELKENTLVELHLKTLEARDSVLSGMDAGGEHCNQLGSQLSQDDTHEEEGTAGGGITNIHFGEEGAAEKKSSILATNRSMNLTTLAQNHMQAAEQHQDTKLKFSLAKARRQDLQEQHQLLIQQEHLKIEEQLAGQNKVSPDQKEKSLLTLHVEMLQKEKEEAERDLEELYQDYQQETEAQKAHMLQVFQAYKKHAEEQMEALEQRYRNLLQESLQDAILLSTQNQQLQIRKQLGCMERAIQTDPSP